MGSYEKHLAKKSGKYPLVPQGPVQDLFEALIALHNVKNTVKIILRETKDISLYTKDEIKNLWEIMKQNTDDSIAEVMEKQTVFQHKLKGWKESLAGLFYARIYKQKD